MQSHKGLFERILIVLFLGCLIFITVGFALLNSSLDLSGSATIKPDGKVYISNVQVYGTLRNASASPTFTDTTIDFNLQFMNANQNQNNPNDYVANFKVTITNDSSYDYEYYMPDYTPTVFGINTNQYYDSSLVGYTISGISIGDTIPSNSSVDIIIYFSFTNPISDREIFVIDGDFEPNLVEDTQASLIGTVVDSIGDLTGSNTLAAYTINVINTYNVNQSFTLSTPDSAKFLVVDAQENTGTSYTIAGNSSQSFTFYLKKAPNAEYGVNSQRVNISFTPTGGTTQNAGKVTALVDRNVFYKDEEAPVISNVRATIQNTVGSVLVEWDATDNMVEGTYTVVIFNSNNTEIDRQSTTDANHSLTVTGLNDGNYYFVVYGTDAEGNEATPSEITGATTGSGHASRNATAEYDWHFQVTYNLTSLNASPKPNSVNRGDTFSTTLTATGLNNQRPESVTVTMGGVTPNNYSYSSSSGALSIPNVTGDIVITASATSGGGCLVSGTKILLANGSYKNIEDIGYTDLLKVYNHVNGKMTNVYPIWIEEKHTTDCFERITFEDDSYIDVVGKHCLFDVTKNRYVDVSNLDDFGVGAKVYKLDEKDNLVEIKVKNVEIINEERDYYNVVSTVYYNLIANNLLTVDATASISNVYGYNDKAIYGDNYYTISNSEGLPYEAFGGNIPYYLYNGLNLRNAGSLINKELDASFLNAFVMKNTNKDGIGLFTISIGDRESKEYNSFTKEEGEEFTLPDLENGYYIETSTMNIYKPLDKVQVRYSMHFEIVK